MPAREQGLRRVSALTTGLAAVGIAGSLGVAVVAHADSQAATTSTSTSTSTGTTGTGTGSSSDTTGTGTTGTDSGPVLSRGGGAPHATSGGS